MPDNGICNICFKENIKTYNFCKNRHKEGICWECFN